MKGAESLQTHTPLRWRDRTPLERLLLVAMGAATLLDLWVMLFARAGFVRDDYADRMLIPSLAIGVGVWILIYRRIWSEAGRSDPRFEQYRNSNPIMRDILMPLFFVAMIIYVPLNWSIPVLINEAIGESSVGTLTITRKESETGRGGRCYRLWAEELNHHSFGHLCVSEEEFRRLHVGDKLSVRWRHSWFGAEPWD